jgi:hypothetical protein
MSLVEKLPPDFSEHFAAWVRLEPRCRRNDFAKGLEARIADPLWSLARQWQTAELLGDDAGSPVQVELTYATQPLKRMRLGEEEETPPLPDKPLEPLVEQEHLELSLRDRVQIGQQFEGFIRAELGPSGPNRDEVIQAYRRELPLNLPPEVDWVGVDRATRRFLLLAAGRVVDGRELLARIDFTRDDLAGFPLLTGITSQKMLTIIQRVKDWCAALDIQVTSARAPAWRNEHLDHRFEVNPSVKGEAPLIRLVAPDYRSGELDWHTFNAVSDAPDAWTAKETITKPPRRLTVGGSSLRWWAFEDSATDFGSMDVGRPDIARLLLMEFVLVFGDDWFVVPVKVGMPNLVRIEELAVRNVFGERITIGSARRPSTNDLLRFDLFTLSPVPDPDRPGIVDDSRAGSAEFLVIPPMAGGREETPVLDPLEEVRFLRDEGANMTFGVEHRIANGVGRAVDGFDAQRERIEREREPAIARLEEELRDIQMQLEDLEPNDPARATIERQRTAKQDERDRLRDGAKPSSEAVTNYRLATPVPANWIPFSPFNAHESVSFNYPCIRLRRAKMLLNEDDEKATAIPAQSRLLDLNEDPLLWLEEATVSRAGLRVQLTGQRMRWIDGKTYVWRGRKVLTGRGEGSSGLRFDHVEQGGQ